MQWEINGTDQFADWFDALSEGEQDEIIAVVERLAEQGPSLRRPHVGRITASKHHNMKELRPRGVAKHLRVLFLFDPRREAILLVGGDKFGQWESWYRSAIPEAEQLYERYLKALKQEGIL